MPKWLNQVSIATPAGVPPISIPSSRPTVTNLDADILDGQHGSYYLSAPNHILPASFATAAVNQPAAQIPHLHSLGLVGDDIAFRTATNVEYWDFGTGAWVAALTSQTNPQILLTGRPGIAALNTVAPTHRKWRFVVQCSTYLGQIMLAVHQMWNTSGAHQIAVTLERGPTASGAWTTVIPETLSPPGENNYHFHVASSSGHSGDAFYRVTVDSKDSVNGTTYTGLQLLFSYTRNGMPGGQPTPFTWDHLRTVTFPGRIVSTLATGTSPFQVASTTVVSNLNADTVDGQHAAAFAAASHAHDWASITGKPSSFTPSAHATSHQPGQPDFLALDHSWLFGLGNDDHPHYLNNARGDARYSALGHVHTFASLTSKPTTLGGYGITDAAAASHVHTFASLTSKPTTLSGYGITDGMPYAAGGATGHVWTWNGSAWASAAPAGGSVSWASITGKPTTLGGYGITDAAAASHVHTFASLTSRPTTLSGYGITDAAASSHDHTFASLTSKPTTLAGYGITDAAASSHSHTWASITSKPTTLSGFGITDAASSSHTHTFASLTSKPTTLSGYGITDAAAASHDHSFASLTGKPTTAAGYGMVNGNFSSGSVYGIEGLFSGLLSGGAFVLPVSAPGISPTNGAAYWDSPSHRLYIYDATASTWRFVILS